MFSELAVTVEPVEVIKQAFQEGLDVPASSFKAGLTVYFTYKMCPCTEAVAVAEEEGQFIRI
jgi:hypothetical protein